MIEQQHRRMSNKYIEYLKRQKVALLKLEELRAALETQKAILELRTIELSNFEDSMQNAQAKT